MQRLLDHGLNAPQDGERADLTFFQNAVGNDHSSRHPAPCGHSFHEVELDRRLPKFLSIHDGDIATGPNRQGLGTRHDRPHELQWWCSLCPTTISNRTPAIRVQPSAEGELYALGTGAVKALGVTVLCEIRMLCIPDWQA